MRLWRIYGKALGERSDAQSLVLDEKDGIGHQHICERQFRLAHILPKRQRASQLYGVVALEWMTPSQFRSLPHDG